jgi:hypothetical protein
MSKKATKGDAPDVRPALRTLVRRLNEGKRFRPGHVVLRLGKDGDVHLDATECEVSVVDGQPARAHGPRAELIGDARIIRAVLEGRPMPERAFSRAASGYGAISGT